MKDVQDVEKTVPRVRTKQSAASGQHSVIRAENQASIDLATSIDAKEVTDSVELNDEREALIDMLPDAPEERVPESRAARGARGGARAAPTRKR